MKRDLGLTVGDLIVELTRLIREKKISGAARILWIDQCREPADSLSREYDVPPETILIGLEVIRNGEIEHGTVAVAPARISRMLN